MEHTKPVYMCGLCRQPYRDPRLLSCLHSFCFDCLQKQLDDSTDQQATLFCPTCFEQIAFPVEDLPRHIHLSNQANTIRRLSEFKTTGSCENCDSEEKACAFCHDCGDIGLRICQQCVECHKRFRSYKKHTVVSLHNDLEEVVRERYGKEGRLCAKHDDEVKYFCQSCQALVCSECIVFSHCSHKHQGIESVLNEEKNEVDSACSALEQALPHLAHAVSEVKDVMNSVDVHSVEVKKEIEETFSAIMAAGEKRKHELLVEAESMAMAKKARLQIQQEDLEKLHNGMKLALDTIQHGTQSYSSVEFLSIKAALKQSCLNLEKRFTNASLTPVTSPSMVARVNTVDVITTISNVGSVEERLPCSPSHSSLVGINTKFPIGITKDTKRTLIVQTRNSRGEPMDTGGISVRAWLTDLSGRRLSDAEVSDSDNGKYSVTFCAQESCLGKAHFTVNGNHIDGSPCDVIVRDYTKLLQEPVLSFSTPSHPAYLHVSHGNGDIFVTLDNGNVCVYSNEGILKSTISGTSLGIKSGRGIVVDEEREVMYIACAKRNKIVKATLDGKLISSVGSSGSGHLQFNWPMGLCQDVSNNIYVADYHNRRVQVLGPDLAFRNVLNCQERPLGMAIDSLGNVHVATDLGMMINTVKTECNNQVSCGDIVIGEENRRFISCRNDGTLEIRNVDNSLLGTFRGLQHPLGVCLDQSGYIFVAEYNADEVHKY